MITSRSGLATPRWRSASARASGGRRDPGRTPTLTSTGRVQGPGGIRPGWLQGMPPGPGPAPSPLIHGGIMLSPAPAAMHSWAAALAPGSSSLPSPARGKMPPPRPADPPGCPPPRGARSPPRRFRARLAYASGHAAWLRRPGGQRADDQGRVRGDQAIRPSGRRPSGHQAGIEHASDKGKLARLVFRPLRNRKDRRWRLSRPRRRTVGRHWGI